MRKIAIFLTLLIALPVYALESYPEVEQYVDNLVNKASKLLSDSTLSASEKVSKSKILMSENLDLTWMAGNTLGHHKKAMSEAQNKQFVKVYSDHTIKSYSDLISNYKGEKAVIKKVAKLNNTDFIVKTEVVRNGQQPIKVDYLIRRASTSYKISDIITEGVSMVRSQQSEFGSIINNSGFDSLLNELKNKS